MEEIKDKDDKRMKQLQLMQITKTYGEKNAVSKCGFDDYRR